MRCMRCLVERAVIILIVIAQKLVHVSTWVTLWCLRDGVAVLVHVAGWLSHSKIGSVLFFSWLVSTWAPFLSVKTFQRDCLPDITQDRRLFNCGLTDQSHNWITALEKRQGPAVHCSYHAYTQVWCTSVCMFRLWFRVSMLTIHTLEQPSTLLTFLDGIIY